MEEPPPSEETPIRKRKIHELFKGTDWTVHCNGVVFHVSKEDMKESGYFASLMEDSQCKEAEIMNAPPHVLAVLLHWARCKTVKLSDCKHADINSLLQLADQLLFQDIAKQMISCIAALADTKNDTLDDIAIDLLATATERRMTGLHDVLIRHVYTKKQGVLEPRNFKKLSLLPSSVLVHMLLAKQHSYCACVSCNLLKN